MPGMHCSRARANRRLQSTGPAFAAAAAAEVHVRIDCDHEARGRIARMHVFLGRVRPPGRCHMPAVSIASEHA